MTDNDADRSHTASPALIGALLHLAAIDAGLDPAKATMLSGKDNEILLGVEAALLNQTLHGRGVKEILAEVAGTIAAVRRSSSPVSLTAAKYEKQRTAALARLGVVSSKGASVWPPTSQTAVQRFGSWNEALKAAGLATNKIGRAKGQLRFDSEAYDKAIAAFVADCDDRDLSATYKAYTEYAAEHKGEVPSAAAVRKFYGGWNAALASAR